MLVPDIAEKVDLVRACEERCTDRMHGSVAPSLFGITKKSALMFGSQSSEDASYLVVKASLVIEVVKVRQIGLAPPDVHIAYLKVVVNWLLRRGRDQ